jgi:hypothetical protein
MRSAIIQTNQVQLPLAAAESLKDGNWAAGYRLAEGQRFMSTSLPGFEDASQLGQKWAKVGKIPDQLVPKPIDSAYAAW